jgi:hypothetical protein
VAESMGGNLPTPSALQAARSRKLNARLENGAPEYPANTNCEPAKSIPPGALLRCSPIPELLVAAGSVPIALH